MLPRLLYRRVVDVKDDKFSSTQLTRLTPYLIKLYRSISVNVQISQFINDKMNMNMSACGGRLSHRGNDRSRVAVSHNFLKPYANIRIKSYSDIKRQKLLAKILNGTCYILMNAKTSINIYKCILNDIMSLDRNWGVKILLHLIILIYN